MVISGTEAPPTCCSNQPIRIKLVKGIFHHQEAMLRWRVCSRFWTIFHLTKKKNGGNEQNRSTLTGECHGGCDAVT